MTTNATNQTAEPGAGEADKPTIPDPSALTGEELAALLKRDVYAQEHIKTLERERAEQREHLARLEAQLNEALTEKHVSKSLEELLAEVVAAKAAAAAEAGTEQPGQQESTPNDVPPETKPTETELLAEIARRELMNIRAAEAREANTKEALTKAAEVYGDSAVQEIEARASELGMSKEEALDMAATKPAAFKKLFLPDTPKPAAGLRSSVRAEAMAAHQNGGGSNARGLYQETVGKGSGLSSYFNPDNYEAVAAKLGLRG